MSCYSIVLLYALTYKPCFIDLTYVFLFLFSLLPTCPAKQQTKTKQKPSITSLCFSAFFSFLSCFLGSSGSGSSSSSDDEAAAPQSAAAPAAYQATNPASVS